MGQAGGKGARGGQAGVKFFDEWNMTLLRVCERGAVSGAESLKVVGISVEPEILGRRMERLVKERFSEGRLPAIRPASIQ